MFDTNEALNHRQERNAYRRPWRMQREPNDVDTPLGIGFSEDLGVMFERFDVVWPRAAALRLILRRPCTARQWAEYHRLRRSLFERFSPGIAYDPDCPGNWMPDVFHLGMISSGKLLGCLQLRWLTATEAALQLMAVQEQRRGEGFGKMMLRNAEVFASANGRRLLHVLAESEAEGFYRKLGFADSANGALKPPNARAIPLMKTLSAKG